jgi:anti-sigma factor RsiW
MNCADLEILLADYMDGTLHGEQKSAVEAHLAGCSACAALARDAGAAVAFVERAAMVEAPPELVTKLLFEVTSGPSRSVIKPPLLRRIFGKWVEPILQPRLAMSMAMTVLSFAMLARFTGIEVRQLKPSDLDPVKVWVAAEDRVMRTWERGVKYYENLRLVFEIQSRLAEWSSEPAQDSASPAPADSGGAARGGKQ